MITKEGFNITMNALLNVFNKEVPKKEAHEIYFLIFNKNFNSDEELQAATLKVIEERVFPSFPKPAEFLEAGKRKDDIEAKCTKAVLEVKAAIKNHGAYRNICFDDPIIHSCIKDLFGGWVKACTTDIEEFENIMKWDFPKIYKYHSSNKMKNVPVFLEGIASKENSDKGIEEQFKIEYIGDKEKCQKWITAYFNKNSNEAINLDKYIRLGYKEPIKLEYMESPIKSLENLIDDIGEEKQVKKTPTGIEYTQEQLIAMVRKNFSQKV